MKSEAWKGCIAALRHFPGFEHINAKQVKTKYHRWKEMHGIFLTLLKQSGFGWNDDTQTVEAYAHVWDDYLLHHPEARIFKEKAIPFKDELDVVYGSTRATGRYASSGHNEDFDPNLDPALRRAGSESSTDSESTPEPVINPADIDLDGTQQSQQQQSQPHQKRKAAGSEARPKKRFTAQDRMIDSIQALINKQDRTPRQQAISILEEIWPEPDDVQGLFKAMKLFNEPEYCDQFIGLTSTRLRELWLKDKIESVVWI